MRRVRELRNRISFPAELRGARGTSPALLRDLSAGGACLCAPHPETVGERIGLTLLVPDGARLSLPADVRWVKESAPHGFLFGVAFAHTEDTRKALQRLIWEIHTGVLTGRVRMVRAATPREPGPL